MPRDRRFQQGAGGTEGGSCGASDSGKIARFHGSGRVTIESGSWSGRRVALVVEEEKQLVLLDRPAHAAAVVIPVLHGLRPRVIVKTSGVQRGVLIEFICAAVPMVGPAFRDHVNRSETIAILRGCIA